MRELFSDVPEACDNTLMIADRCNVKIDLKTKHAPIFKPQEGSSPDFDMARGQDTTGI